MYLSYDSIELNTFCFLVKNMLYGLSVIKIMRPILSQINKLSSNQNFVFMIDGHFIVTLLANSQWCCKVKFIS